VEHSCFANLDDSTEAIYVVETDRVYRGTAANVEQVQENVDGTDHEQSSSVSDNKKGRNKEDKQWADYDELLIDAVMKRPCLWNHTIPVKQRSPLVIKEAWIEIASELNGKFEIEMIKKR
ncbi:histone H3, partial [Lasius niger]